VVFNDIFADTLAFPAIADSLTSLKKTWLLSGGGSACASKDGLKITTGISMQWQAGIPLPLGNFDASISVRFIGGSSEKFAGFFIGKEGALVDGELRQDLRCGVASSGSCSIQKRLSSGLYEMKNHCNVIINSNEWNRLTLSRLDGCMIFSVNDKETARITDEDSTGYGIGFFAIDSLSLELKNFQLDQSIYHEVSVRTSKERRFIQQQWGSHHYRTDLLGRLIPEAIFFPSVTKKQPPPCILVTQREKNVQGL
jgi:hypothetical protein